MKYILLFPALWFIQPVRGQELTLEKSRVVVIPASTAEADAPVGQIVDVVIEEMSKLGRFEVLDRSTMEATMQEASLGQTGVMEEGQAVQLGKMLSSKIGVLVSVANYSVTSSEKKTDIRAKQQEETDRTEVTGKVTTDTKLGKTKIGTEVGAKKEHEETKTDLKAKVKETFLYDAVISVSIKQIEIETGKLLESFTLMGRANKKATEPDAVGAAINDLRTQLSSKLKTLYQLKLMVLEKAGRRVTLAGGRNVGVQRGMTFTVTTPGGEKTVAGRTFKTGGSETGIIKVRRIDEETSVATILRGYGTIGAEQLLQERINAFDVGVNPIFSYGLNTTAYLGGLALEFSSYNPLNGGINIVFGSAQDNRDEGLMTMRSELFFNFKFLRSQFLDFGLQAGGGVLGAWRDPDYTTIIDTIANDTIKVDALHRYKIPFFGGGMATVYFGDRMALTVQAGYYLNALVKKWYFTEEIPSDDPDQEAKTETTEYKQWDPTLVAIPRLDMNGLFITAGLKFIF